MTTSKRLRMSTMQLGHKQVFMKHMVYLDATTIQWHMKLNLSGMKHNLISGLLTPEIIALYMAVKTAKPNSKLLENFPLIYMIQSGSFEVIHLGHILSFYLLT